jgi:hypothetical protein
MAFDLFSLEAPAVIQFLYDPVNEGIINPGDVIVEYRGRRISNVLDLVNAIYSLPEAPAFQTIDLRILRGGVGDPVLVLPIVRCIDDPPSQGTLHPTCLTRGAQRVKRRQV